MMTTMLEVLTSKQGIRQVGKRKRHKIALEQAENLACFLCERCTFLFYSSKGAKGPLTSKEMSMNINNQRLGGLIQHATTRALLCSLTLVGLQPALSGSAYAQAVQPPIAYGQTVERALGGPGDDVLPDGRPIDRYRLVTQVPGQSYVIRAASLQIPVASQIAFIDTANQRAVPLQQAQVFLPGQQVLYAGRLPQPGIHIISVFSRDPQQPIGTYTLSLTCLDDDDADDDLDDLDDRDDCPGLGDDDRGRDDNGGDDDNGGGDDDGSNG